MNGSRCTSCGTPTHAVDHEGRCTRCALKAQEGRRQVRNYNRGKLADGTPYDVNKERRCAKCNRWCSVWSGDDAVIMPHGTIPGGMCGDSKGKGRFRLNVSVASRLPDRDGKPRWNPGVHVNPTPDQRAEIMELVAEAE